MLHTCCGCVLEKVTCGAGEELHDGPLLERRRVRDVDEDRRALKSLRQTLACEGVDACVGRSRHHLVAMFPQGRHELGSDEPGTADDDEFHDRCPFCEPLTGYGGV